MLPERPLATEVGQLGLAGKQQDVGRLDIVVRAAHAVHMRQRAHDVPDPTQRLGRAVVPACMHTAGLSPRLFWRTLQRAAHRPSVCLGGASPGRCYPENTVRRKARHSSDYQIGAPMASCPDGIFV